MNRMDGYLLVDKPEAISSFGVVAKVRAIVRQATGHKVKIGHTGTLDPFATGLLILVLGKYTKRAEEFSKLDKTYEAELILGKISTTGDPEGEISSKSRKRPSKNEVEAVLKGFKGEITQKPHRYSAVKIGGQRAYKLARAGKIVETTPRKVKIHEITDVKYQYPNLNFTVSVSSGTYVRSLTEDIGQKLGTGAYLSALRRTRVGEHSVNSAVVLQNQSYDSLLENLRS